MTSAISTSTSPDAVRELLDAISESDAEAQLPVMATAELYTLGGVADLPMVDARALSWWGSQPDQESLALRALDHLVKRGLIDPETRRVDPWLALILLGRASPAFIAFCRESPEADPAILRVLGVADRAAGLRAVLIEGALPVDLDWAGPAYDFALAGARKASADLAGWAAGREHRTIDLYVPGTFAPGSKTLTPTYRFVAGADDDAGDLADKVLRAFTAAGDRAAGAAE